MAHVRRAQRRRREGHARGLQEDCRGARARGTGFLRVGYASVMRPFLPFLASALGLSLFLPLACSGSDVNEPGKTAPDGSAETDASSQGGAGGHGGSSSGGSGGSSGSAGTGG